MADCLISSVQEIGKCILTQHVWPFLKSQVDYWWFCDINIKFLMDEISDLEGQIDNVTKKIDEAPENAEIRRRAVHEWLSSSKQKLEEARTTLPNGNIPAWKLISRYLLGKNAKETAEAIKNHLEDGTRLTTDVSTMDFDSRKHIEEKIIEYLEQGSAGVIGICGMGGLGKTTMAKRIGRRVKEENLFEEVAMTTVSRDIDEFKIQGEIAEDLGLELDKKDALSARAEKLRKRLSDRKRKIIIFDDVWYSLEFKRLGIPIESDLNRCKFLFTSRSSESFKDIKNKEVFELETLGEEEAWNLFRENAGKCAENFDVARDIVKECKGLPIALATVGSALLPKRNIREWKDCLSQLRKSNPIHLSDVLEHVYKPLQLSYDYLDTESERRLFLLCCLFPEDFVISVEQLTWYSLGLGLFDDINNIEEARDRTHTLIENLKRRFLLIDVDEYRVKMHDVIRDVAIYIGSREKDVFLKSLHGTSIENSSDINDKCNWMSVDISNEGMEVSELSRFPNLRLLMLQQKWRWSSNEILDISVEGMTDLNVLSFRNTLMRSLPQLGSLKKLHTLCLVDCKVENISVIGELTSLRLLELSDCEITSCPKLAIKCFLQLEVLEIKDCWSMEEVFWSEDTDDSTDGCIEFPQLKELTLTNLPNLRAFCKGLEKKDVSFCNLKSIDIRRCPKLRSFFSVSMARTSLLQLEDLVIGYCGSMEQVFWNEEGTDDNTDGCIIEFPKLKELKLWNLQNLTAFCQGLEKKDVSFCNLKSIEIIRCPKLRSLFSVSVARTSLLQLEDLVIGWCESMEQVFWNEEGTDDNTDGCIIEFPKLKELTLCNLQNLTAFCQGLENIIIKFPNLTEMEIGGLPKLNSLSPLNSETVVGHDQNTCFHFLCNPKVEMCGLKILRLEFWEDNIRNIWCHQIPNNIFNNLETLIVRVMNGIRSLMSTSIAKNLVSLKELRISDCKEMVEVIERDDDDDKQVVDINCLFPKLRQLIIRDINKLRWFWQWNHALELPLLEKVEISNCPVMEAFTLGSINTPNIRKIEVNNKKIGDQKNLNDAIRHIVSRNIQG